MLAVALAVVVFISIDALCAAAIRSGASAALGVPVELEGVRVGIASPPTTLTGLAIANPPGCTEPEFLSVRSVEVASIVPDMLGSDVKIPLIRVVGLSIDLEKMPNGRLNTDVIFGSNRDDSSAGGAASGGRRVQIAEVEIKDITLRAGPGVSIVPVGATLHLDSLVLRNIDSSKSDLGLSAQLTKILVTEVVNAVVSHFGSQLADVAREAIQSTIGVAAKKLGEVFTGQSGDAGAAAAQHLEEAGEKIGDALGGAANDFLGGLGGKQAPKGGPDPPSVPGGQAP